MVASKHAALRATSLWSAIEATQSRSLKVMDVESGAVSSDAKCKPGDFIELDYEGEVFHGKVEEIDGEGCGPYYMNVKYISPASGEAVKRMVGSVEPFYIRRYVRHLHQEEVVKYKLMGLING